MKKKALIEKIAAVAVALLVWQIAAMIIGQDILLVTPVTVIKELFLLIQQADFLQTVWFSLCRIAMGFFCALILGSILAGIAGRLRIAEILLWPFMLTVKTVPVASFIVISLIWLTSGSLSVFISFLMSLPIIYTNLLQGIKSTDKKLLEMSELFRLPWHTKAMYIYAPQMKPFLMSACSVALGLSWKAGIAAEVIGIPGGSIGERLYDSKLYLDTAGLFAWTVVIVLLSITFEKIIMFLLKLLYKAPEAR